MLIFRNPTPLNLGKGLIRVFRPTPYPRDSASL